jgi:hypothetical protein
MSGVSSAPGDAVSPHTHSRTECPRGHPAGPASAWAGQAAAGPTCQPRRSQARLKPSTSRRSSRVWFGLARQLR